MPQIETWSRLPVPLRDHLVERMRDRNISVNDLNRLRLWMETKPEVPEGPWYKDLVRSSFAVKADIQKLFFSLAKLPLVAGSRLGQQERVRD
jgi:hypothetical protein